MILKLCLIVIGIPLILLVLLIIYSNTNNVYRPIKKVNYSYAEEYTKYNRYNSYDRYGQYGQGYNKSPAYRNNPNNREVKVKSENGTERVKKLDIIEDFSESTEMSAPNKLAGISVNELKNNLTPDNADVLTANESSLYEGVIEEILQRQSDKEIFTSVSV